MTRFGSFFIWVVIIFSLPLKAGWVKSFDGGEKSELGIAVQQTADEGYTAIGTSVDLQTGEGNIWLLRTDQDGNMLWEKTYGPVTWWNPCGQQTLDDGFILAGATQIYKQGGTDIWLVKTDEYGDVLWTKIYGGPLGDIAESIQQTNDGGYVIVGFRNADETEDFSDADMWILKTDADGDTVWTKTYGVVEEHEYAKYVSQTSDSGYIVTCQLNSPGDSAISIMKTDALGDSIWTFKTYQTELSCIWQISDSGYIATGVKDNNIILLKLNNNGEFLWEKNYGDSEQNDGAFCVQGVEDGNIVVTGFHNMYFSHSGVNSQGWLLKVDPLGDTLWSRLYRSGGTFSDARWIDQTSDGGYIMTGGTQFSPKVGSDLFLMKIDSEGNLALEEPVTQPTTHSRDFELLSPIGRKIVLRYADRTDGFKAEVFDASGRKVAEIRSASSSGTLSWGLEFSPGVYFIRETLAISKHARKVILLR